LAAVNQIVSLLENGEWHSFEDLRYNCSLPEWKIEAVLNFLNRFEFLQKNNIEQTFRLSPELASFFSRVK